LQSSIFESTKSETKSQQSTSQLNKSKWLYQIKFHELSLVSWNIVNFCKISQILIKFCKSLKDLRKILLKWLGKTVNFANFCSCHENSQKLGKQHPYLKRKFTVFNKVFLGPKLLFLTKFWLVSSRLWLKSFASHKYHS
jgi:hypothetical protein